MATKIHVVRSHSLGKVKAHEVALKIAERMKNKAQVNYRVQGDVITMERSGVHGTLRIGESDVEVNIELGLMMRPMKGLIETKLGEYFDRYLTSGK